jgi:hypothetical protein
MTAAAPVGKILLEGFGFVPVQHRDLLAGRSVYLLPPAAVPIGSAATAGLTVSV